MVISMGKKKYLKVALNLFIALLMALFFLFIVPRILVFFMPFVVAGLIAMIANPLVKFLEGKVKIKRKAGTVVVIVTVIGLIILAGYLIISKLIQEAIGFYNDIPIMWEQASKELLLMQENWTLLVDKLPINLSKVVDGITKSVNDFGEKALSIMGEPTIEALGNFAKSAPGVIISIIMGLIASYFFIAEKDYIVRSFHRYVPEGIQKKWYITKHSLAYAVGGYFKAQLKIEIWIYLLMVIGFAILGVDYILLIALGIACLDFFPFFGTGIILAPWAAIQFLSGDYKMAIGLLIIWGAGQLVRQLIQPKIMGDSVGLPPIPTIFLLYLGYRVAGVIGMILAVPIGLIVLNLYQSGIFETTQKSIRILICGMNRFRRIEEEDMKEVYEMERKNKVEKEELEKHGKL